MKEIVNKHKAPKDTLLNSIMQEIDEENGLEIKPKEEAVIKVRKKRSFLKLLFNFILTLIFLVILFVLYVVISSVEESALKHKIAPPERVVSMPVRVIAKKVVKKTMPLFETHIELFKKPKVVEKRVDKPLKIKLQPKKKTQRELAKEALRQQMLH